MKITILKDGIQIALEAEASEIASVKEIIETALKGPELKVATATFNTPKPTLVKYPDGIDYSKPCTKSDMRYYKPFDPDVHRYKIITNPFGELVHHKDDCDCGTCLLFRVLKDAAIESLKTKSDNSNSIPVTTLDGIKGFVAKEEMECCGEGECCSSKTCTDYSAGNSDDCVPEGPCTDELHLGSVNSPNKPITIEDMEKLVGEMIDGLEDSLKKSIKE